jgi:hypothetical protein
MSSQYPSMASQLSVDEGNTKPGKPIFRTGVTILGAAGIAGVGALGFAFWQPEIGNPFASAPTAQAQQVKSKADRANSKQPRTPFYNHAHEAGIATCADVFPALGEMLTSGSEYAVQTEWDKTTPNAHSIEALAGLTYKSPHYTGQAVGIVFASPAGNSCEGNMVRVAPFAQSCQDVVGLMPKGSTLAQSLNGAPLYNLGNNGGQALLLTVNNACVVVSVARMAE